MSVAYTSLFRDKLPPCELVCIGLQFTVFSHSLIEFWFYCTIVLPAKYLYVCFHFILFLSFHSPNNPYHFFQSLGEVLLYIIPIYCDRPQIFQPSNFNLSLGVPMEYEILLLKKIFLPLKFCGEFYGGKEPSLVKEGGHTPSFTQQR